VLNVWRTGGPAQEINVKLWRSPKGQEWSAEINGQLFENIAIGSIERLVERAMIGAELSEEASRRPQLFGLYRTNARL
jgi:hypothetical protein